MIGEGTVCNSESGYKPRIKVIGWEVEVDRSAKECTSSQLRGWWDRHTADVT